VDAVDEEGGVEDRMDKGVEGDVVAVSEGRELELGLEVEVEIGNVDEGGMVELDSSLVVDDTALPNRAGFKAELDVVGAVDDASMVEDVSSHVGVTGMTVNPPSSSSSPASF
jgi:hypothetical protein